MAELLLWVLIGFLLVLSLDQIKNYLGIKFTRDEPKKPLPDKNPDGTQRIEDETLFGAFPIKDVKLVMVVREDLKMTKGKIGAQCGHATLGAVEMTNKFATQSDYWKKVMNNWSWEGQKKVCVKVMSEQEL